MTIAITPPQVADAGERTAALDPARSFIVQAPAGSGKTGLLIQRVLRLLATVERPEEVLAITFTRKAAAEMRRRLLEALARAASEPEPVDPDKRLTWRLARAALERDQERGWSLAANPARLRIQTIDSLCASLARQMPVLSRLGAPPAIVEDASLLHREAAERTLGLVESNEAVAGALAHVLRHLDGDWGAIRGLLEVMLAKRDQWLRALVDFEIHEGARAALEAAFAAERERILARIRAAMPAEEEATIVRLAVAASGRAESLAALATLDRYPGTGEADEPAWRALADLLVLKSRVEFREKVDKRDGFPPGCAEKDDMLELLARLGALPGLAAVVDEARRLPPARFTDRQWEVLGALVTLLPRAAAELELVFAERGEIDFPGLAQGAVRALGDADAPTDLLLALDVRIRHLLVDEFQDTSLAQWDLLTRLTGGWQPDDGRTVFLVGDPMQSIYRFREANVGLFLRARGAGLPEVALDPRRLEVNFRSRAGIVRWVNGTFGPVLAAAEDADAGAVPYAKSTAHHPEGATPAVQWHPFVAEDTGVARAAEGERAAQLAAAALAQGSVAILVRNRRHLDHVVPALRRAGVRLRAVDIEPLGERPVILELLAITRALAHPADRIAWLSLLRAPWCGLDVADLHALAGGAPAQDGARLTVWELLHDEARLGALSPEGRVRTLRLRERLAPLMDARLRDSLRERVERAWLALGGPASATVASDLEDAETFLDQLDAEEEAGDLPDVTALEEKLAELYAAADTQEGPAVQLMTIHKAKGLEFGTVIVPGLDRPPRAADRPLLAWKARADGTLLMAPVRAAGEKSDAAYDHLRHLDDEAGEHEASRLFYVAVTRAVERLHLLGVAKRDAEGNLKAPAERSLLRKVWEREARAAFEAAEPLGEAGGKAAAAPLVGLRRLGVDALEVHLHPPAVAVPALQAATVGPLEFSWAGETARHIGIVAHRWLQRFSQDGLDRWDTPAVDRLGNAIAADLARRGIPPGEAADARERVLHALRSTLADPRGRWVLGPHRDARSEYRIVVASPAGTRLLVIDRTFIDEEGRRWIVDYKTGRHEGGDPQAFLDREVERYAEQLAGYAAAFSGERVAVGLYFPLMAGWREKSFS